MCHLCIRTHTTVYMCVHVCACLCLCVCVCIARRKYLVPPFAISRVKVVPRGAESGLAGVTGVADVAGNENACPCEGQTESDDNEESAGSRDERELHITSHMGTRKKHTHTATNPHAHSRAPTIRTHTGTRKHIRNRTHTHMHLRTSTCIFAHTRVRTPGG